MHGPASPTGHRHEGLPVEQECWLADLGWTSRYVMYECYEAVVNDIITSVCVIVRWQRMLADLAPAGFLLYMWCGCSWSAMFMADAGYQVRTLVL